MRFNPVLIPWELWDLCKDPSDGSGRYENGFIVLVDPQWYFENGTADAELKAEGLELGVNALLVYRRRAEWLSYREHGDLLPNGKPFVPATSRTDPLGGTYFARVHATRASGGGAIVEGFNSSELRGAGIRVYEYASSKTIQDAKLQLECLAWSCRDAMTVFVAAGMSAGDANRRMEAQAVRAHSLGLWDVPRLQRARMLNGVGYTVCPLCLEEVSAADFLKRSEQAEGRETHDITTTEISIFHIQELRVGKLQHKPYNLGWGHHHCNTVVKDAGIVPTLEWMKTVIDNNGDSWETLAKERTLVEEAVDL